MEMFVACHKDSPHKIPFILMTSDSFVQVSGLVPSKPAPFEPFKRGARATIKSFPLINQVCERLWMKQDKNYTKYCHPFKQLQINFKKLLNSKPKYDIMATLNTTYGGQNYV